MKKLFLMGIMPLFLKVSFSQDQDSIRQYKLDEIIVSATRMNTLLKEIPQKVEVIDQSVINSVPSENFAELLKRTTNLDIIQYPGLSASMGMRGFSPSAHSRSYTLLLINGIPSGTTDLASINTDNIERVEVVKGPYSALYGSDAMGGVINIITKSGVTDNPNRVSIDAGSFGYMKLRGDASGVLNEKTAFTFGYSRQEQQKDYRIGSNNLLKLSEKEKLILDKTSYNDVMYNSKYQINHVNGQLNQNINDKWSIGAEVLYTFAYDVEIPGNYWGSYGKTKKDIDRLNLYGNIQRNTESNTFTLSPYCTWEDDPNYTNNSDTGFVSFNSNIREYGFKMHDNLNFGKIKLLVGADLDIRDYKSERFKAKASPTNPYAPDHKNTKAALLAQLAYSVDGLYVNGGGRFDNISYDITKNDSLNGTGGKEAYNTFNPSVGIQYTFPFHVKLHGSFGTAFSVPDAFKVAGFYSVSEYFADWNFWWIKNYVGNPDLKPESSATYDFGINYALPNKLAQIDLTYFQTKHRDKIIENILPGDTTSYKNANNSVMCGLELMASSNLGTLFNNRFKLEIYSNFTFMLKNEVDETLKGYVGNDSIVTREVLYTRRCNGNFGIFFNNYKGVSTRLNARYIGSRLEKDNFLGVRPGISAQEYYTGGGYTASDEILEHPDYLLFDYSVYYTMQNNKRLGITISNLFDENFTEKDGYNMPGRMVTGSFTYSF